MRSLVLPLLLAVAAPLAAAPRNAPPAKVAAVDAKAPHGDPELQSLRRQLASAVLLAELKLTTEQKSAMKSVLADARKLRDQKRNDPELATFRAERKTALRAAIDEVHSKGSLSDKTKESMKDAAEEAHDDMDELRPNVKELRESVLGILTPAQIEHMKELREKRMKKLGKDGGGKGPKGGRGILRLVLSDEFAAELAR